MLQRPTNVRRGLTLIELLIVIAVIALLMSILVPSLARSRYQARVILCGNQLRNLGRAYNVYGYEWNDWLPVTPDGSLAWDFTELHDVTSEGFIEIREILQDQTELMFCPFWFDIYDFERFTGTEKDTTKIQRILQRKYWYRNDRVYTMGYALMTHWSLDNELYNGGFFYSNQSLRVTRLTDPPSRVLLADYAYFRGSQTPPQWEDGIRHLPPTRPRFEMMHGFEMEVPEGSWHALLDGSAHYRRWEEVKFRFGIPRDAEYWW